MDNQQKNLQQDLVAYEYLNVVVKQEDEALRCGCYENFGWTLIGSSTNFNTPGIDDKVNLKFRRNRNLEKREELNILQKKCEISLKEIAAMEMQKTALAMGVSIGLGILAVSVVVGGVFAFLKDIIALCIPLFILGAAMFVPPYFAYEKIREKKSKQLDPLIEKQMDNIHALCMDAKKLLK